MTSFPSIKQRMGRLKSSLENPHELSRMATSPSEEIQIYWIASSWKKLSKPMLKRMELMFCRGRKK